MRLYRVEPPRKDFGHVDAILIHAPDEETARRLALEHVEHDEHLEWCSRSIRDHELRVTEEDAEAEVIRVDMCTPWWSDQNEEDGE